MNDIHAAAPEPSSEGELFLDFINTLELSDGMPADALPGPSELRDWLSGRGLLGSAVTRPALERQLPAFQELRTVAREVVERLAAGRRPTGAQVEALNRAMRDGIHHHELRLDRTSQDFTVVQVGDPLDSARSAIAGSLAHYLADHATDRLRVCANDGCRWVFVDRSPAARRRWCDMRTCGNRAKVARHRARRRSTGTPARGRAAD